MYSGATFKSRLSVRAVPSIKGLSWNWLGELIMDATENLYCKVFVDGDMPRHDLVALVAECLSGSIQGRTVVASAMEVDINDNDDFVPRWRRTPPDDFVYFRFFLDVEPGQSALRAPYVAQVGTLLKCLRGRGLKAVAACDFEQELPQSLD
jgi:hypothetical protein